MVLHVAQHPERFQRIKADKRLVLPQLHQRGRQEHEQVNAMHVSLVSIGFCNLRTRSHPIESLLSTAADHGGSLGLLGATAAWK